jgi:hypothetical protein
VRGGEKETGGVSGRAGFAERAKREGRPKKKRKYFSFIYFFNNNDIFVFFEQQKFIFTS